ncbi:MAG: hypothetical protein IKX20_03940 [Paludibacteraceae bacterium]|nr:hypothetical protein [Paludibacteraceae bacterium]
MTLVCDNEHLISRWKNDENCEWRTEEWLATSLASLRFFSSLDDAFDTNDMSVQQIADAVLKL